MQCEVYGMRLQGKVQQANGERALHFAVRIYPSQPHDAGLLKVGLSEF